MTDGFSSSAHRIKIFLFPIVVQSVSKAQPSTHAVDDGNYFLGSKFVKG
jgi:hypothetical protein